MDPGQQPDPDAGTGQTPGHTDETDAAHSLRAQMLATEHWGLLASRSTAQSEVLTRITIFLTLVSAGLVTIGLLGQVTRFDLWFSPAALTILGVLILIGVMTQARVVNVSEEDMMYVVAMNRLRGGYVDLDDSLKEYLLTSPHDDREGMMRTYSFFRRRDFSQLFGSSAMLLAVVNASVLGLFVGGIAVASGATTAFAVTIGSIAAVALLAASLWYAMRTFVRSWQVYTPRRPSTDPPPFLRRGP